VKSRTLAFAARRSAVQGASSSEAAGTGSGATGKLVLVFQGERTPRCHQAAQRGDAAEQAQDREHAAFGELFEVVQDQQAGPVAGRPVKGVHDPFERLRRIGTCQPQSVGRSAPGFGTGR
jgi:hypothetical protein